MIIIEDTDFSSAWARAVRRVLLEGTDKVIGDRTERKPIRDVCAVIELTGNAIGQIENHKIHPQFPFRFIDQYVQEYTPEFQEKYMNAENETIKFTYTYYDRLTYRADVNQLITLREGLKEQITTGISSNRNQAITWIPGIDAGHPAAPCLQRIWIRHIKDRGVEVHLTWRSRDLFTAWQANIIAIIDMLNRDVIRPNNCQIVRLIDFSNSLHIYKSDLDAAEKVKLVGVNPMGI